MNLGWKMLKGTDGIAGDAQVTIDDFWNVFQ
jgi:hypothetical protein